RVIMKDNHIFSHKIMRIKYSGYDTRRDEDLVHVETDNCNFFILDPAFGSNSADSQHPYCYRRILGIFHANFDLIPLLGYPLPISANGDSLRELTVEFLWVRWYKFHPATTPYELDTTSFLPISSNDSLGFICLINIIRACHLIPRFTLAQSGNGTASLANDKCEWNAYFVNKFVDCEMFMRYLWGDAIGHTYS
ncbi:hypothetical protein FA15DRAFT_547396, partial [Coprinopsis marcescibilis]